MFIFSPIKSYYRLTIKRWIVQPLPPKSEDPLKACVFLLLKALKCWINLMFPKVTDIPKIPKMWFPMESSSWGNSWKPQVPENLCCWGVGRWSLWHQWSSNDSDMILIVVFVVCDVSKSFCLYCIVLLISEKRPLKSQAGNADYDKILNIIF